MGGGALCTSSLPPVSDCVFWLRELVLYPMAQPLFLWSWKQWKEPKPHGSCQCWLDQGCAQAFLSPREAERPGSEPGGEQHGRVKLRIPIGGALSSGFRATSTSLSLSSPLSHICDHTETGTAGAAPTWPAGLSVLEPCHYRRPTERKDWQRRLGSPSVYICLHLDEVVWLRILLTSW